MSLLNVTLRLPSHIPHVDLQKGAEIGVIVRRINLSVAPFQAGDHRDSVMDRAIHALNAVRDRMSEAVASGAKSEWVGFLHTMAVDENGIPTIIVLFIMRYGRTL